MRGYLFSDMKRAFFSWKFLAAVFGTEMAFCFFEQKPSEIYPIVNAYHSNIYAIHMLLCFVFCMLPYGDGMCQDVECRFYQSLIIRGKTLYYVLSKAFTIFLSSGMVMVLGTVFYILIIRIQYPEAPWSAGTDEGMAFDEFISNGMYGVYILLCGLKMGCLTGILGMVGAVVSMYIANRLMVFSLPIISFYMLNWVSQIIFMPYKFYDAFDPLREIGETTLISALFSIAVIVCCFFIFTAIMNWQIKRRLSDG